MKLSLAESYVNVRFRFFYFVICEFLVNIITSLIMLQNKENQQLVSNIYKEVTFDSLKS